MMFSEPANQIPEWWEPFIETVEARTIKAADLKWHADPETDAEEIGAVAPRGIQ